MVKACITSWSAWHDDRLGSSRLTMLRNSPRRRFAWATPLAFTNLHNSQAAWRRPRFLPRRPPRSWDLPRRVGKGPARASGAANDILHNHAQDTHDHSARGKTGHDTRRKPVHNPWHVRQHLARRDPHGTHETHDNMTALPFFCYWAFGDHVVLATPTHLHTALTNILQRFFSTVGIA